MNNIETRKEVASTAYALDHFDEDANIMALQQAWLAGFETAYPKWNKVEDLLPEDDRIVLIKVKDHRRPEKNITEISLGYYDNDWRYDCTDTLVDSGNGWFIEEWMEIPE